MDIAALIVGGIFLVAFVVLGVMILRPINEND
jgi:hypothetical protein